MEEVDKCLGCDRKVLKRGLCWKHYQAWHEAQAEPCSVEGCSRGVQARTLCKTHYQRHNKGLPLDTPIREKPSEKVEVIEPLQAMVHKKEAVKTKEKVCQWCQKECLSPTTTKRMYDHYYHVKCLTKYNQTVAAITEMLKEQEEPKEAVCRRGHPVTPENRSKPYFSKSSNSWYTQCIPCVRLRQRKAIAERNWTA